MEKKTAEEILRDNAAVPKPQIPGVLNAMEEYSSLQSEELREQLLHMTQERDYWFELRKTQSEEKDKEIERLREALRSMVEFYESIHQINSELITDDETEKYKVAKALLKQDGIPSNVINNEVVKLREACKMAKTEIEKGTADQLTVNVLAEALSNQPIESDKIMKEEKQNGYASINITQAEEIEAKDRRIKELEEELQLLNSRLMPKDAFKDIK